MRKKDGKARRSAGKKLAIALASLASAILIFVLLCVSTHIPRSAPTDYSSEIVKSNPLITRRAMVSAHRAGRDVAPENTLSAFEACLDPNNGYSVDFLEFDLHLTKDGKLILLHDDTLDRTSDCATEKFGQKNVKPIDHTLAELKKYNMGHNFESNGKRPYRGKSDEELEMCRIVSIEEVLDFIAKKEEEQNRKLRFTIEIKDKGAAGKKAVDILYGTLKERGLLDRTVMASFHGEVDKYMTDAHPDIIRSASIPEALGFYFSCMFGIKLDASKLGYKALNIPYKSFVVNMGKKSIVDYAHAHGIAVHYWTINDEKDIRHLKSIGADGIISDDPALAYATINE